MSKSNAIVRLYQKLAKDHLLLLQSIQTATLMGTGDLIAQTVIEGKPIKKVNFLRTGQFCCLGAVFVGPCLGTWYKFLAKTFTEKQKLWVLKKVAADQLIFAPCFLATFVSLLSFVEGHDWAYAKEQLQLKYTDIMLTNYQVWPAVQLGNFYFTPLRHQVLLVQSVALFWNIYLSWKAHQGQEN